eukprot:321112-Amphidinium_carterae.2
MMAVATQVMEANSRVIEKGVNVNKIKASNTCFLVAGPGLEARKLRTRMCHLHFYVLNGSLM